MYFSCPNDSERKASSRVGRIFDWLRKAARFGQKLGEKILAKVLEIWYFFVFTEKKEKRVMVVKKLCFVFVFVAVSVFALQVAPA